MMGGKEAMIFLFYLCLRTINLSEVSLIIAAPFTMLLLRVYQQSHYNPPYFQGFITRLEEMCFRQKLCWGNVSI